MTPMLEAALGYAEAGYKIFPLKPRDKSPHHCLGKDGGYKHATNDLKQIEKWWVQYPNANIGFPLGFVNGLIAIDVDYKNDCDPNFLMRFEQTVTTCTANGGHHPFFKITDKSVKNGLVLEKGATVRSDGYYVVLPPSIFINTDDPNKIERLYSPLGRTIVDGEFAEIPEWIFEFEKKTAIEKKPFQLKDVIKEGVDERDNTLHKLACSLRSKGMEENEILASLEIANNRCEPKLLEKDLLRITNSAMTHQAGQKEKKYSLKEVVLDASVPFPHETEKGRRLNTIENLEDLIKRINAVVRYNVITKGIDVVLPGFEYSIDNKINTGTAHLTSLCELCRLPTSNIRQYLLVIADKNQYNPVVSWINSKEWDGQSRLKDFFETVKSNNEPLKEKLMRAWLISAVAAAYSPVGVSAHGVLVFRGKQYLGKTAWFKRLVPKELGVIADGMFLRPDDKDSVFQVLSNWVVELGELDATFRKSDISQLKAFITKDHDVLRRPYAQYESEFPRRTVFFGSVNESDFLKDPTGNRRFWTIECEEIDYEHCIDMQQLWAEVYALYKKGEKWVLPVEYVRELNAHNKSFESMDPIEERIRDEFYWEEGHSMSWKHATKICMELGINNPSQRDTRMVVATMRKLNAECRVQRGYTEFHVPSRKVVIENGVEWRR